MWGLSVALEGWLRGSLNPAIRLMTGVAALAVMFPPESSAFAIGGYYLNIAGAGALAALYVLTLKRREETA